VVHRRLSKSFSKISPVVVVLERPDHGKYFAWVLSHELLGIVTEDEANHLTYSLRATSASIYRPRARISPTSACDHGTSVPTRAQARSRLFANMS
jgi:hypothetical protein